MKQANIPDAGYEEHHKFSKRHCGKVPKICRFGMFPAPSAVKKPNLLVMLVNASTNDYFKGRKGLRKKLLQFLRFLEDSQKFFPTKSQVNREPQKFFPAKPSSFAKPQKFFLTKRSSFAEPQNTMNTSSQWKSLEFKDDLEI